MIFASVVFAALLVSVTPAHSAAAVSDTVVPQPQLTLSDPARLDTQPARFDPLRFDTVTANALRVIFDSASAHHLPVGPLVNKANMGVAQRAPGAKIVIVVRQHLANMADARAALGDFASEHELDSGAEALKQGLDGKALQAIRLTRPLPGSAVTSLVVLSDLVKRGISSGKARDAVTSLGRASRTDEAINGLQVTVARNAERGPGMAQDALERYLRTNASGTQRNAPPKPVTRPPSPPDAS